jgi:hypothetical protein
MNIYFLLVLDHDLILVIIIQKQIGTQIANL